MSIARLVFTMAVLLLCSQENVIAQILRWEAQGRALCTAAGWQKNPYATTDGRGGAIAVWEDIRSGTAPGIYAARISTDGARPWMTDGIRISSANTGQQLAGIVSDGVGGAYIAWWHRGNGSYDVYAQRIDSAGRIQWSENGYPVCRAQHDQQWAAIRSDGQGGCIIAWQDKRGQDNDIYAQRFGASNVPLWGDSGIVVTNATGDQLYPDLAGDGSGGAYIVWMDRRAGDDVYGQRLRADGSRAWTNDAPIAVYNDRQIAPRIVAMSEGRAAILWQDFRSGNAAAALYLQLIDPTGTQSFDQGYQIALSPKSQSGVFFTDDGRGGAMASWTDFRNGLSDGDVYTGTILPDGTIPQTASIYGQPICTIAGTTQELAQVLSDSAGGAFIVWQDKRNTFDYDLYVNRISAAGLTNFTGWDLNGTVLIKEEHDQLRPQIVASGRGSAIVVWVDGRVADGQADIYAQKVDYAPWLSSMKDTVRFGIRPAGSTTYDTLVVSNSGPVDLTITDIRRPPGNNGAADFRITSPATLPITLKTDSSLRIPLVFTPSTTGLREAQVRIKSNYSVDPFLIPLTGIGTNPKISTPSLFIFGPSRVGSPIDTQIVDCITNSGTGPLVVTNLRFAGEHPGDFSVLHPDTVPFIVDERSSLPLRLRFTPSGEGSRSAILEVVNATTDSVRRITLRGAGGYPTLTTSPSRVRFDRVMITRTSTKTVEVRNTGGIDLRLLRAQLDSGRADQFAIDGFTATTIPPNGYVQFSVTFRPTEVGSFASKVNIESDDPATPHRILVDGIGDQFNAEGAVAETPEARIIALSPQPCPPTQALTIEYGLTRPTRHLQLELRDLLGRILVTATAGKRDAGRHITHLQLGTLPSPVPPGVYMMAIEAEMENGTLIQLAAPVLIAQ